MKPIIYQLLVRLAGNRNTAQKPFGSIIENGCGKFNDLDMHLLQSLKGLGITHLWLTGIIEHATCTDYSEYGIAPDNPLLVKGIAGSPYAIKDYYDVCPDLACSVQNRMQEFEALIERCHQAGLKPVIDFVPNHVARQYNSDQIPAGTQNLGHNDQKDQEFNPNNNFYYLPNKSLQLPSEVFELPYIKQNSHIFFEENPARATGNDRFNPAPLFTDWYETVKLNYGVDYLGGHTTYFEPKPDTWMKMTEILHFWAAKGVCGFRCDMAEMVPIEFWEYAIKNVKEKYPQSEFIAEVYKPDLYRIYIERGGFDYLYDKAGFYNTVRDIITRDKPAYELTSVWQSACGLDKYMLRFLENHDEQRIASPHFAGSPWPGIAGMAAAALMHSGPVMIYFGQEIGEDAQGASGFSKDNGRTTIFDYYNVPAFFAWFNHGKCNEDLLNQNQKALRQRYASILQLCSNHIIASGRFYDLMWYNPHLSSGCFGSIFAFLRWHQATFWIIAVNFSKNPVQINVKVPEHFASSANVSLNQPLNLENVAGESILPQSTSMGFLANEGIDVIIGFYDYVVISLKPKT